MPPSTKWRPADFVTLIAVTTASLCMLILVCGATAGVLMHRIEVEQLGSVKGVAVGSGLLGFMSCITTVVIKVSKNGR
jgi:hypothetical protein